MIFEPLPVTEDRVPEAEAAPRTAPANEPEKPPRAPSDDVVKPANRYDVHFWGIYIMLCLISVIELYSASSREIVAGNIYAPLLRHLGHLMLGFFIIIGLQRVHYRKFFKATPWIVFFSILAMVYTLLFGQKINGAIRSFDAGIMNVQPAEFLKFSAVLLVAYVLCKSRKEGSREIETWRVNLCALVVGVFGGLLFFQGLTNTLLLMGISLSMMFVASVSVKKLVSILLVFGMLGATGYLVKKSHAEKKQPEVEMTSEGAVTVSKQVNRTGVWDSRMSNFLRFDKYKDTIRDNNAQEQYSYIAQAHGGIKGVGPGNSRETSRLSLAFSDYIYAIVVEEGGLLLGLFVILLYLWLMLRAANLAYKCSFVYPALLMLGMAAFIVMQAMFHMGIVTGAFPVSGQPLPLISKGGTSIIVTSLAFGVMLSVSRHALQKGNRSQIREEISSLPEDLRELNPSQNK